MAECSHLIRIIHEARADFEEALNVLYQAFSIKENSTDDDNESTSFVIVILHRIDLIHGSIDDSIDSINILENTKNNLLNTNGNHIVEIAFNIFGYDTRDEFPKAAAAA